MQNRFQINLFLFFSEKSLLNLNLFYFVNNIRGSRLNTTRAKISPRAIGCASLFVSSMLVNIC